MSTAHVPASVNTVTGTVPMTGQDTQDHCAQSDLEAAATARRDSVVKPIQTHYAGHLFRSRLEARWAVFFDTLRIRWEYEPQGFVIGMYEEERPYLPDFYLPDLDVWVEVKGSDDRMDWSLLGVAVDGWSTSRLPDSRQSPSGGSAIVVLGNIPPAGKPWIHWLILNRGGVRVLAFNWTQSGFSVHHHYSSEVGYFDASWGGFDCDITWTNNNPEPESVHGEEAFRTVSSSCPVLAAYTAARRARFEHGEVGR